LLVALGAVTGLALGVVLAERAGGRNGLTARARLLVGRRRDHEAEDSEVDDHAVHGDQDAAMDSAGDHDEVPFERTAAEALHPDEAELEERVLEVFRNDPTLRGRAIDIGAIGEGTIELTGWVHSEAELAHALTLARGVPDVADVMVSLTVRGTDLSRAGQPPSDR
jgi:hypothetical protein